jgi:sulfite exporter TauE/SafE
MELWTALAIGFFGSFHCVGMCGPIALALPGSDESKLSLVAGRILYNIGRIVTYSLLGLIVGVVGHSIALAGLQKSLSVLLGALIIISGLSANNYLPSWKKKIGLDPFFDKLKKTISAQFKKRGLRTLFTIGILNGLLPCGFVYVGLAGSVTTGSIVQGGLFMALFGLGTFPIMFLMSLAPGFITLSMRRRINAIIPYLAIGFGIYLVYRGIMMGRMLS